MAVPSLAGTFKSHIEPIDTTVSHSFPVQELLRAFDEAAQIPISMYDRQFIQIVDVVGTQVHLPPGE